MSEKLHRAFDLTPHPWTGASNAFSEGMQPTQGIACLRRPPEQQVGIFSRSVSVGSIFLKQQQLRVVSGCIYFIDSLVFFQGMEAVALPLLE